MKRIAAFFQSIAGRLWDGGRLIPRAQKSLFWSWNGIFMLFIFFGLMPLLGPGLFFGLLQEEVNLDFFLFFMAILLMAPAASWLGRKYFRNDPGGLFRIFYGVEVPLFLLLFFRVIFLRDLNPGVGHLLFVFACGSIFFLWSLLRKPGGETGPAGRWRLAGNALFFWCAAWVFLFLLVFIPPAAWNLMLALKEMVVALFDVSIASLVHFIAVSLEAMITKLPIFLTMLFFTLLGMVLVAYTATLFIALPFVYIYLGFSALRSSFLRFWDGGHRALAAVVAGAVLVGNTLLFFAFNAQDHNDVLVRMQAFDGSDAARRELLEDSGRLRRGLTDIYLSPYRYLGDADRSNSVQALYKKTFGLSAETTRTIQTFFNAVARPLLYGGSGNGMATDQKEAARLYAWFFDRTIQEGERGALRHALQATYSREQRDAGLVNIDDKKVYLQRQSVEIQENGDWAEIEIHETYLNRGKTPEEVFYHLALPENAVVTGVWLGPTESERFRFQVASRGAAQKVYKRIQRQGLDPALMEQVGPNLYRLRVFPIPGNRVEALAKGKEMKMHLWWTYKVLRGASGWELPRLIEKRNVYWDFRSRRLLDGASLSEELWLPERAEVQRDLPSRIRRTVVDDGVELRATPLADANLTRNPSPKVALVLETSYSMGKLQNQLQALQTALRKNPATSSFAWDYYRLGSRDARVDSPEALFSPETLFFGSVDAAEILSRFDALREDRNYDAVVILTDRSSFKEVEREGEFPASREPVWFYLVDGEPPRVTGDGLMRHLIASGGGLETDWEQLTLRLGLADAEEVVTVADGTVWTVHATDALPVRENGFDDLAVKQYLQYLMTPSGEGGPRGDILKIHTLAGEYEIVSPYSSMLVLVTQGQRNMLKDAEKSPDRFLRDMETGQEILNEPAKPFEVSAVPEPEEWALILIVLTLVLHRLYRNRDRLVWNRTAF